MGVDCLLHCYRAKERHPGDWQVLCQMVLRRVPSALSCRAYPYRQSLVLASQKRKRIYLSSQTTL